MRIDTAAAAVRNFVKNMIIFYVIYQLLQNEQGLLVGHGAFSPCLLSFLLIILKQVVLYNKYST